MRKVLPEDAQLVPEHAELVFQGIIFSVYQWQQLMFDGSYKTFEMLKRPDTVRVIAVKDDQIVVLYQEQPGYKPFYDLPGGRHDVATENEWEAIQRETWEETGMTFTTWKLLDVVQPQTKVESFLYTFLATDFVEQQTQSLDSGEKIDVHLMSLAQVKALANDPQTRYLPWEIFSAVNSIAELVNQPSYGNAALS